MNSVITCEDVGINVGFKPLLRAVTFSLDRGETLAAIGPNGCGKTTLLRCLAGVARPHKGNVTIWGEKIWPQREAQSEFRCVFLASSPALLLDMSVAQNLEFLSNSFGVDPTWAALRASAERVGLKGREGQIARTLSTGQKRRLTLAALLMIKPGLVLSDEPTNGLDDAGRELCKNIFAELVREKSCAVLMATHDGDLVKSATRTLNIADFARGAK